MNKKCIVVSAIAPVLRESINTLKNIVVKLSVNINTIV